MCVGPKRFLQFVSCIFTRRLVEVHFDLAFEMKRGDSRKNADLEALSSRARATNVEQGRKIADGGGHVWDESGKSKYARAFRKL